MFISIVLAARQHLDPGGGFQQNRVFVLRATHDPLTSQSGEYGCTIPLSHRFFSAIEYRVSPRRSRYRLQKASVPKFRSMTPSNFLAPEAKRNVSDVEILHVVTAFTVFDDVPAIEEEKYRRQ